MGIFGKLLKGRAKKSQYMIGGEVASTIDGVIAVQGFQFLDEPHACIVLDSNMSVSYRSGRIYRGGNILAVAKLADLPEFLPLKHIFKPSEDPLFSGLDMDSSSMIEVAKIKMETMGYEIVDRLAYAILREFSGQSPEFSRLPST